MYAPSLIDVRRARLEREFGRALPHGLEGFSVEESLGRMAELEKLRDDKGRLTRPLTREETEFVLIERLKSKIDYRYWARYCVINLGGSSKGPLFPLWKSQELILAAVGKAEQFLADTGYPDGIFINILKARQYGASTLSESLIAHRLTTHANFHAAIAADVPDTSANLFDMLERTIDHLPWYMKPRITDSVKNDEIAFSTDSWAAVLAAKSTRGTTGKRGQMGRGFTYGGFHLTELSTFEGASQLDDAFFPGVARDHLTLGLAESTAKGRGDNWWYTHWFASKRQKVDRPWVCVFIPWYAEPERYWLPCPEGWEPDENTKEHAARAEKFGPFWMGGPVRLTREQLYWYEHSRNAAIEKDELAKFLEEYPADDEEAFQYSGKSVFDLMVRERIRRHMRPILKVLEVRPAKELLRA